MKRYDIHEPQPFFEYARVNGSVPPPRADRIDVALLDMNHRFKANIGHDSLVHIVLETAESLSKELAAAGRKVRVLSFDVRDRNDIPQPGRFRIHLGTGGPGHLDPRLNDGLAAWSQDIQETTAWEKPLFHLFDEILSDENASMIGICHSFGLICRWSGIARPVLRSQKSEGLRINRLSREAMKHPWFEQFARDLPDHQHFHVVDNRLFDLVLENPGKALPLAFEAEGSSALTMVELARDPSGAMSRFLAFNHHPEILDREHGLQVLAEKLEHGDMTQEQYEVRRRTMMELFGEKERLSRLTSHYTLIEPLRFHLRRALG